MDERSTYLGSCLSRRTTELRGVCRLALAGGIGLVVLGTIACGESVGPESTDFVRIVIEPSAGVVSDVGDSLTFVAYGERRDASRETLGVAWESLDTTVARVGPNGVAHATGQGVTLVRATHRALLGLATISVDPDTLPPTLVTVSAARTRVNVGHGPETVPIRAEFQDDRSDVRLALAVFDGPLGAGITSVVVMERLEDDPSPNFVFEGLAEVPSVIGVGTWTLDLLQAEDTFGNRALWNAQALEALGLTVRFQAFAQGGE